MFGSNTGVCNVEPTPMEVVVPVSGVGQPWGGGRLSACLLGGGWVWGAFVQFRGRWSLIGKCVVLEKGVPGVRAAAGHQGEGAAGTGGAACALQGAPPGTVWLRRLPSRAFPLRARHAPRDPLDPVQVRR